MNIRLVLLLFLIVAICSSFPRNNQRFSANQKTQINYSKNTTPSSGRVKSNNNGFGGFNDAFKNQMASLLAEVTKATTPETVMLKNKLMIGLISIDNTLNMINKDKRR